MRLWFAKCSRGQRVGLMPTDEQSHASIRPLGDGECVQIKITRVRSVPMNKMYFAICREIGMNQDPQRDEDSIDYELRILAGHYEVMFVGGKEVRYPKRIAFEKLTHDEWMELWPSLELAMNERFGEGYVREQRVA